MKERPILFGAPMVRAILEGRKTQTRRVMKPIPQMVTDHNIVTWDGDAAALMRLLDQTGRHCPYGQSGDRLWVRETWCREFESPSYCYRADDAPGEKAEFVDAEGRPVRGSRWKPSIHMPRSASRILLEVTNVRVERLQDISEADAIAEGADHNGECDHIRHTCEEIGCFGRNSYRGGYAELWEQINGDGSWESNPWVWVVEFKRVTP